MDAIKPPRLRKGDLIGLVSPASTPLSEEKIQKAVQYFERLGYKVKLGEHAATVHGYLAGTDPQRAADFNQMTADKEVKAIFPLRGGYGTPRILQDINYAALRRQPKIIGGYSDITALQLAIFKKTGLVTFSSPMPAVELWDKPDPLTEEHFWAMICSPKAPSLRNPQEMSHRCERPGRAEGLLFPGNLALLVSQLATPYCPSFRRAILLLEEIDEYPYRVDRMFAQLKNAQILDRLAGLALGQFTDCNPPDPNKPFLGIEQVLQDAVGWTACPVLSNFAYGHVARKLTIPMGVRARLDARAGQIRLLEPVVQ